MSDLAEKIQKDLVSAMKQKDELSLSVLRMLKSALQLARTEKGKTGDLTDDDILVLVRRLVKQRVEGAAIYRDHGAADRADRELAEVKVLERYLPAQLSDEELAAVVADTAAQAGATGPRDMGKVMGKAMAAVAGRAEGGRVKAAVQKHLASLAGA